MRGELPEFRGKGIAETALPFDRLGVPVRESLVLATHLDVEVRVLAVGALTVADRFGVVGDGGLMLRTA